MNAIRDPTTGRTWATPRELIDHVEATYHGYLRLTLPLLDLMTEEIARKHAVPPGLMDRLQRQFTALADLLEMHLAREECRLFPKIRHLREPVGETAWACQTADSIEELMERSAREDKDALDTLERVEECLRDSRWSGKGPLLEQFAHDLRELREHLLDHFHLETDVLFPAVRELLQGQALAV